MKESQVFFSSSYANGRTDKALLPDNVKSQVYTSQALGFQWVASHDGKMMMLGYQGIDPNPKEPELKLKKWLGNFDQPAPHMKWMGESGRAGARISRCQGV